MTAKIVDSRRLYHNPDGGRTYRIPEHFASRRVTVEDDKKEKHTLDIPANECKCKASLLEIETAAEKKLQKELMKNEGENTEKTDGAV